MRIQIQWCKSIKVDIMNLKKLWDHMISKSTYVEIKIHHKYFIESSYLLMRSVSLYSFSRNFFQSIKCDLILSYESEIWIQKFFSLIEDSESFLITVQISFASVILSWTQKRVARSSIFKICVRWTFRNLDISIHSLFIISRECF